MKYREVGGGAQMFVITDKRLLTLTAPPAGVLRFWRFAAEPERP